MAPAGDVAWEGRKATVQVARWCGTLIHAGNPVLLLDLFYS